MGIREPILEPILRKIRTDIVIKYLGNIDNLCDIECGQEAYLLKKLKGKINQGYGIDKELICKNDRKITLVNDKLDRSLPFPDHKFDAVTLIAVLEHLEFPEEIIEETYRILKPAEF